MTADLSALIARLEAAEVGSRELDHLIFMHTAPMEVSSHWSPNDRMTLYTTSLDAALALAERVLGERVWYVRKETDGSHAGIFVPLKLDVHQGVAKTPALALCIAILRAKQGEGE